MEKIEIGQIWKTPTENAIHIDEINKSTGMISWSDTSQPNLHGTTSAKKLMERLARQKYSLQQRSPFPAAPDSSR